MKSRIAVLALFCSLAGSLAFAGENPKSASDSGAQPSSEATASSMAQVPCTDQHGKDKNKAKVKTQPAQTQQEKEFEHMLMGIFG